MISSPNYFIKAADFKPAYLALHRRGELHRRAEAALAWLKECTVCPRNCGVNRWVDKTAACKTGRFAQVSSYFPHRGEKDCLRGWNGSGTIFFGMCNLRCVFCQNADISQFECSPALKLRADSSSGLKRIPLTKNQVFGVGLSRLRLLAGELIRRQGGAPA